MTQAADLTQQRFGYLTALEKIGNRCGHAVWLCECRCGNRVEVAATNLKKGHAKSCGCFRLELNRSRAIDITGQRYGRAVVIKMLGRLKGHSHVDCLCDCGNLFKTTANQLRTGMTRSCGCLWEESITKHGQCNTPEYECWSAMIQRCFNPKCPGFENYGGRGIAVCDQWRGDCGFEAFFEYMGERPSKRHSIDRYPDNDGDYEPGNVRWATSSQQARNRRNTRLLTANGTTMCVTDWATQLGIHPNTIHWHLKRGRSMQSIADNTKL